MAHAARLEAALARLAGLPMWAAGRAGSILWLHFGSEHLTVGFRGEPKTVGDYALHVDCPWRWVEAWGDLRADDHFAHEDLAFLGTARPVVISVALTERHGLHVAFDDSSQLLVEPDDETSEEYWRLFEPGRETDHFVVGPHGLEVHGTEDEA